MPEEAVDNGLTITARQVDLDVVLVEIAGELDLQTAPQAQAFLTQVIAATPRHLILDLSGVTFMASSGMAVLIAAQSARVGFPGGLHLLGVIGNHPVESLLDMAGLLDRFDIASDLNTVLAGLGTIEP
jgi:anti-sigma B factor antagonist